MNLRPDVVALLLADLSDRAIVRELGVSKRTAALHRRHLGLPPTPASAPTLAGAWAAYAQAAGQTHMRWTGPVNHSGTPVLTHRGVRYSARAVAFQLRYGREAVGYVKACCDFAGCIAPACVADKPMRDQLSTTYDAIFGGTA
ncbi:hypothetical protein ACWCQM_11850 [Streptomyces sp. NPDC002125]